MTSATMDAIITGVFGQGAPLPGASSFSQFIAFGDSSIDSGYYFTHPISNNSTLEAQYQAAVAAGGGLPTSLGGVMNSTLLAQDFGLTATPVGETGGTNYAASSATVGTPISALAPTIPSQMQTYLTSVSNHADSNALYLISGGGNDVTYAESNLSGAAAQDAYMVQQANTLAAAIEQLYAAGARNFLIHAGGSGSLGNIFNDTLYSDLAAANVSVIAGLVGTNVKNAVNANPAAYGITDTTIPPAGPFTSSTPYNSANGGADINPIPSSISAGWARYATQLVSPNAGQAYLYADDQHFSAAGQQIEANYFYNLITNATPTVSETLAANGQVAGVTSPTFAFQWQSLAPNQATWSNISGATGSTYVVQQTDLGSELRVQETYTDSTSVTTTVVSSATPAVVAATNTLNDAITELYIGYYNRAPDPSGENYWVGRLESGMSLIAIAQSYSVQTESTTLYPFLASPNTASTAAVQAFVTSVYENLFNRAPDPGGEAYWVNQLQSGASTVGGAIINIISGAQLNDLATINNKVVVGDYFDTLIFNNNVQFSASVALAAFNAVTFNQSSIATAEAIIEAYVKTAAHAAQTATASQTEVGVVGVTPSHDLAIAA